MGPLTRIGAATQNAWRRLRRWSGSAAGRGACGRVALCGLLLVLTGNGKGKSSSAFGMLARALGHGMQCGVVQCGVVRCGVVSVVLDA